ncbi:hypothetical protein SAMN02982997_01565 [Legionella micdadei]|uniref:Uncharacterized protein n=1 Tax=Legionella micdadei TaxID=451 RepID=A0A1G5FHP0_LEGMI|nr:hypothetical protein Lmic_1122 [Legionella micdadei]SCY38687.1 hypothetical protein SAMN02982997_01565 [Legionella micdadei]
MNHNGSRRDKESDKVFGFSPVSTQNDTRKRSIPFYMNIPRRFLCVRSGKLGHFLVRGGLLS